MPSDHESDLLETPSSLTTPFSIAARSTGSSVPAKHTRNFSTRRPVRPTLPKSQARSSLTQDSSQTPSTIGRSLSTIPTAAESTRIVAEDENDDNEDEDKDNDQDRDGEYGYSDSSSVIDPQLLQTSGLESSFSQSSSGSPFLKPLPKRQRPKTSTIYQYCSIQDRSIGECYICNYCRKAYKSTGGTALMRKHLRTHGIDLSVDSIAIKRLRDGTAIEAAILRGAEINKQAEEKRRKELIGIGLNKTTLEFLYIQ
ncbi:MAG: hypothetical protein Q9167_005867 [Letrouitia subvulpina]